MAELEAGRELDRLVAERVMGWRVFGTPEVYAYWTEPYEGEKRLGDMPSLPRFSTDIAAAWTVVERMREMKWLVRVQEMPDNYPYLDNMTGEPLFYAKAYVTMEWMPRISERTGKLVMPRCARATTAPLSICRAALAAAEGRGEG